MSRGTAGFTIIEVLVAMTVMAVGIVALAGSASVVTRMIGRGQRATRATEAVERQLDSLRQAALATTPSCGIASGSASLPNNVTTAWTVGGSGRIRTVRVVATYRDTRANRSDTVSTAIYCP